MRRDASRLKIHHRTVAASRGGAGGVAVRKATTIRQRNLCQPWRSQRAAAFLARTHPLTDARAAGITGTMAKRGSAIVPPG